MSRHDLDGLVDIGRLSTWLDDRQLGAGKPLSVHRITAGHSNELFVVERGELRLVLRRPPATPLSPTAHDMVREHRVLSAILAAGGPVPIAAPVALCEDPGVIGAPFLLMEFVDGVSAGHGLPPALDTPGAGAVLATALIDTLGAIHSLDWRAAGLEGFGRPDGFLERQVGRWSGQLRSYGSRPIPELEALAERLDRRLPESLGSSLIHGDFMIDNVLLRPEPPIALAGVVDWEMSTIGDPLVDLGWMLGMWTDRGEEPLDGASPGVSGLPDRTDMPTRAELAEQYARVTGMDLTDLDWYVAFGLFKLAVVMEGSHIRFVAGTSDDPYFGTLERAVPQMAERALAVLR